MSDDKKPTIRDSTNRFNALHAETAALIQLAETQRRALTPDEEAKVKSNYEAMSIITNFTPRKLPQKPPPKAPAAR